MHSVAVIPDYRSCQTVVSLVNISYKGCLNSYIWITLAIDSQIVILRVAHSYAERR